MFTSRWHPDFLSSFLKCLRGCRSQFLNLDALYLTEFLFG